MTTNEATLARVIADNKRNTEQFRRAVREAQWLLLLASVAATGAVLCAIELSRRGVL